MFENTEKTEIANLGEFGLIDHLTKNDNNTDIWKSEIFGRSLDVIVQEGIQAKLSMMPDNVRFKLCQTLTKIINKGSSNMIAIVL